MGFCVECEDQPASLFCQQCVDDYCDVCFQALHRKGKRLQHLAKKLVSSNSGAVAPTRTSTDAATLSTSETDAAVVEDTENLTAQELLEQLSRQQAPEDASLLESMEERAKWIPVRLTLNERKALRLLEAALSVSEYTDKIDVLSSRSGPSKPHRMVNQIRDLCAILCGLVVSVSFRHYGS
jgi:hypothetical protein